MTKSSRAKARARRGPRTPSPAPSTPASRKLTRDPIDEPRPTARSSSPTLLELGIVLACVVFVLVHLRPDLLFASTTPTGGDLGAHVWGPQFLRGHLFDRGLLAGWSNDWFGGFPAYRFYMPVPAFGAVALGTVLPYGVALKLMEALPLVALPLVAWRFARAARLPAPGPCLIAVASLLFLFDSSNVKFGGSVASSIAGEYGNALAITLALWCFAVLAEDLERGRRGPAAGVIGALAACCHPIGLLLVVVGLLALLVASALVDRARAIADLAHLGVTLLLVVTISAFWYVPFYAFRLYTNDLSFQPVTGLRLLFPLAVPIEIVLAILFVTGLVDAFANERRAVMAIAIAGALFALAALVAPRGMLWNARLAPAWYLTWVVLAGAGAGALVVWVRDRAAAPTRAVAVWAPVALTITVLAGLAWDMGTLPGTTRTVKVVDDRKFTTSVRWLIGPSHTPSVVPAFVKTAFGGYERDAHWHQYQALIATLRRVAKRYGCGRLMPEFDPTGRYGSVYADDLMPYWTDGCIATLSGLYNDSSPTSAVVLVAESALSQTFSSYEPGLPYEHVSIARGVHYLRELGARYYLASSKATIEQARHTQGLREIATVDGSVVFLVDNVQLVQPLGAEPLVAQGAGNDREKWEQTALAWFGFGNENLARFVSSGPDAWQRVTDTETTPTLRKLPFVDVTKIRVTDRSVRFHVSETGTPVLVRVSYFPWWHATGAHGPYRAAPNWMIVVPTSHDVVLTQRTQPVEWIATFLTLLGVLIAIALAVWTRAARGARSR